MSLPPRVPARRRLSVAVLASVAAAAMAGIVVAVAPHDLRTLIERGIDWVRAAGPGAFFIAMALVPAPLAWFTIPAGEAFAGELTLGGVIAAAALAVAVQLTLAYGIARHGLRPAVEHLLKKRGYHVPRVTAENALAVALLVRLVPGPPLIVGSCILALAEVPFRLYLVVSWLVALPWVCAGVILGRGILHGDFALVAAGAGLVVAAVVAARLVRRRWLRGKTRETA